MSGLFVVIDPCLTVAFIDHVQVASGFQHTMFLTQEGALYSVGTNTFGQLGYTGEGIERVPRLVPAFANRQVTASDVALDADKPCLCLLLSVWGLGVWGLQFGF